MADNQEAEENNTRGTEWEVVSLTASTYAAAPGPKQVESKDDEKIDAYDGDEAETSQALFMSGHFVFPPKQHESLPFISEIHGEQGVGEVVSVEESKGKSSGKHEETWGFNRLDVKSECPEIQFYDEKGNDLSIHGSEFGESITLQGTNLADKDKNLFDTAHSLSTEFVESVEIPGQTQHSDQSSDISPRLVKKGKTDETDFPSGAWWKRRATSLYVHAKDTNACWSIFVAAAVMGLVVLGHRWQQERRQSLQLKWQISINDQKPNITVGPTIGLKGVILGREGQGSFIRSSSASVI